MTTSNNQLHNEKSPYLLQHKDQPVHWYAWGQKAFDDAKKLNRPIFLSIGYATCHWCHVMAHESFEDEKIAERMNQNFICIKVDREERPDVDDIYMSSVQIMGQPGGWPLSVFLTPDLKPFFGGTYFHKTDFLVLVEHIAKIWKDQPEKISESAESIFKFLKDHKTEIPEAKIFDQKIFENYLNTSLKSFDPNFGGFGKAPKFPHPMQLRLLLRIAKRDLNSKALSLVTITLQKMAEGGIYDQLGSGFSRYSTDAKWLIPHFEKMLYDNALLTMVYLEAWQVTQNPFFKKIAKETLDYILEQMTAPEGGFYSAEDADSEGHEGKFYVFKSEELKNALTEEEFKIFSKVYGVSETGNFENQTNVLFLNEPDFFLNPSNKAERIQLENARQKILFLRQKRTRPLRDDKILTSWNGLMISAMAKGFKVLDDIRYLNAAIHARNFIYKNLYKDEKLLARYRDQEAKFRAYLDDYAFLIQGLLDLYDCDFDAHFLRWALDLQKTQDALFLDKKTGAYFFSDGEDESLIVRTRQGTDSALPNGNAVTATNLLRFYMLELNEAYKKKAEAIFHFFSKMVSDYPFAFSELLIAYDLFTTQTSQMVLIGDKNEKNVEILLQTIQKQFLPHHVTILSEDESDFPALLSGKKKKGNLPTFYFCRNNRCEKPLTDFQEAVSLLQKSHSAF